MSKKERKQRGKMKEQVVFPQAETLAVMPVWYHEFIADIKQKITAQIVRTRTNANADMILLYWQIGNAILQRQEVEG